MSVADMEMSLLPLALRALTALAALCAALGCLISLIGSPRYQPSRACSRAGVALAVAAKLGLALLVLGFTALAFRALTGRADDLAAGLCALGSALVFGRGAILTMRHHWRDASAEFV